MESLRGHINPFLYGEEMNLEFLEPGGVGTSSGLDFSFDHHNLPFLQMLQGTMQQVEEEQEQEQEEEYQLEQQTLLPSSYSKEPSFQLLLRLQQQQDHHWRTSEVGSSRAVQQLDSCVTHASESQSDTHCTNQDPLDPTTTAVVGTRQRKKRKRSRPSSSSKNAEEAESQRMTHIAVERNRRRLMNDHLAALRSLMPPSFVQRGDQASIIGGAIDFVKELEQLLLSLHAEKRMRMASSFSSSAGSTTTSSSPSSPARFRSNDLEEEGCHVATSSASLFHGFFLSPQYTTYSKYQARRRGMKKVEGEEEEEEQVTAAWSGGGWRLEGEDEGEGVDVEATVVQGHVNLKVVGRRKAGQLVRAISAIEEQLHLTVLHLNITSLDPSSVLYSLNLKMEEECKLGSADEIATAVHRIFTYINGSHC